eukprot:2595316-Alexandrium_andersonii.AAC.1
MADRLEAVLSQMRCRPGLHQGPSRRRSGRGQPSASGYRARAGMGLADHVRWGGHRSKRRG